MAADDGTNRGAARPGSGPAVWLFWSAVWLALVFVGAKLAYLAARRDPGTADSGADLLSLAAITYRDVVFVIGAWAIARAAMAALRLSRIASGAVAVLFAAFAAIVSLYAIASVIAFGILGGFLTYSLLQLIGSVRMIESSVGAYLTRRVAAALVGGPLLYLAAVAASVRVRARVRAPARLGRLAPALALAWIIVGQRTFVAEWATHYDWRIADNAPWILGSTWFQAMTTGERPVRLTDQFDAADLADFEPIGQRTAAPLAAPAARRRAAPPRAAPRPPNVILFVLESVALRWTSFGGRYDATPVLKSEAARALVDRKIGRAHV